MLIYKKGDILQSTEDIICHQCNTQGIFGGGLAYQIKQVYPKAEEDSIYASGIKDVIGTYIITKISDNKYIANCFSQNEDYSTNYNAIRDIFNTLLPNAKLHNLSICVPYKYGCGIASGDWNIVENIFKELSEKEQVDITIYEYNKEEI